MVAPMETVNIHDAKTHLSRLVERAARGEPFVIARAGKPLVKVVPLDAPADRKPRRLGFLQAAGTQIPASFDRLAETDIQRAFEGGE
jgi:prevent-host-death family protein